MEALSLELGARLEEIPDHPGGLGLDSRWWRIAAQSPGFRRWVIKRVCPGKPIGCEGCALLGAASGGGGA